MCCDPGGAAIGSGSSARCPREEAPAFGHEVIRCLTRHESDAVSSRGVVQILNNVSRIHKQRQVDNKEAVAAVAAKSSEQHIAGSSETEVVMVAGA